MRHKHFRAFFACQDPRKETPSRKTHPLHKVSPVIRHVNDTGKRAFLLGEHAAAEIACIGSIATGQVEEAFEKIFDHGQTLPGGPATTKLLEMLREAIVGKRTCEAMKGWLRDPTDAPQVFCKP
jgi:hypothetical protein